MKMAGTGVKNRGICNTSRRCSMMAQLSDPIDGRRLLHFVPQLVLLLSKNTSGAKIGLCASES